MGKRLFSLFLSGLALLYLIGCSNTEKAFEEAKKAYVEGDYETALKLFEPLAEKGHAPSQIHLAFIHARALGVEKNDQNAFIWMKKAAETGEPLAEWMVGYMYLKAQGIKKNEIEAEKWIRKAADGDIQEAKLYLEHYEKQGQWPSFP